MKKAKRLLKKDQGQEFYRRRQIIITEIMNANGDSYNQKLFYKLVQKQRSTTTKSISELVIGNEKYTPDEILSGWSKNFGELASPSDNTDFTHEHKHFIDNDILHMENICSPTEFTYNIYNLPGNSYCHT